MNVHLGKVAPPLRENSQHTKSNARFAHARSEEEEARVWYRRKTKKKEAVTNEK